MNIRFSVPTWIALGWATAIVLALWLNVPFGVPNEWIWSQRLDTNFEPNLVLGAIVTLLAICAFAFLPNEKLTRAPKTIALTLVALLALSVALRYIFSVLLPQSSRPTPVFWALVIASPVATSFYDEARNLEQQGLTDYLRNYHEQLATKPFHAATHPPGLPMLFWIWRKLAMNPTIQKLTPLDSASIETVREIYIRIAPPLKPDSAYPSDADLRACWWVALFCFLCGVLATMIWAWWVWQINPNPKVAALIATTPSALWWQITVDSVHLLFVTATCASAFCWQRKKTVKWAILTGLLAGLTLWLAFKNAIPLACIALWLIWLNFKENEKLPIGQLAIALVLAFSPYLLAWLLFGFQPLATFKAASVAHHAQAGAHARSYVPWVLVNFADFAMGLGGAWIGLVVVSVWNWFKKQFQPSLMLATLVVLIALDLSGLVRGEVARLWLPFFPLLTFESAKFMPQAGREVALMAFLQGGIALALQIQLEFLRPF